MGGVVKSIKNVVQKVVQTAYQPIKDTPFIGGAIDKGLVNLDKSVGKAIPGGWGTVGMVAASFIPGVGPLTMAGLGALNGSGMLRKDGKFNLQGAMMGGAMGYGMANLASGLQSAGGGGAGSLGAETANIASNLGVEGASTGVGSQAAMLAEQNVGMGLEGLNSISSGANQAIQAAQSAGATMAGAPNFSYTPAGEMVPSNISADITGAAPATTVVPQPSGLENLAQGYGQNVTATGQGLANLTGLGEGTSAAARTAFGASGANVSNTLAPIAIGGLGLADIQAQEDLLNQQQAAGTIDNTEYNTQMARINEAKARATEAMNANPYQFGSSTATNATEAINQNPYQFAIGGSVIDGEAGGDDNYAMGGIPGYFGGGMMQRLTANPELLEKLKASTGAPASSSTGSGFSSGLMQQIASNPSLIDKLVNATTPDYKQLAAKAMAENPYKYAEGGMAEGRFLSGGGDGLSDDIPATIGDNQPAKLADGEFVISSDVVSNLGNGSSKAGAKKLYDMMDRVRKQAHGTTKQIRKVNANKALPA